MDDAATRIERIEALVGQDVGRSIQALVAHSTGGLLGAARAIADHPTPHVAVMTGFYVPWAPEPAAESDGPVGAAHILGALTRAGIPCRAATDSACQTPVKAALAAAGVDGEIPCDVVAVDNPDFPGGEPLDDVAARWHAMTPAITHVLSIERVGPASDGRPRNFRGEDIGAFNAPLDQLFTVGPWTTIAIGDGGNELGMGRVPRDVIAAGVKNGERIACTVSCDHLIVCGVSNWGGYALPAALALTRPDWREAILNGLTRDLDHEILRRCVEEGGAVDGIQGVRAVQADGLPYERHAAILRDVLEIAAPR